EAQPNPNVLGVKVEAMLQILAGAPCVTLVHSHGAAVGAGAEIVVACDYRCATDDAMFMVPGFRLMGVSLGNSRLAKCIGPDQAMRMILHSDKIDSAKAFELGLVTDIVQADALDDFVAQLEQALETTSKPALSSIKTSVHQANNRKPGSYAFEGSAHKA
ncbi:MAG: enoyl-CoA hydratase/isomerase family protein, partial [Marinosulfonomonas sp.]|nr:enoyl-CoA hydratase/isomerase family protein [Marinosulfonomonas sp.]